jgi:hypothetical protein
MAHPSATPAADADAANGTARRVDGTGGAIGAFAAELRALTALLDPGNGWYSVFTEGDPDGMRDCLNGREVPPWDVIASLLHDVSTLHGAQAQAEAERRLRQSYGPAVAVYDELSGGETALRERLSVALRDRDAAAARENELAATEGEPSAALAWARDYHARVAARCAELRTRLGAAEAAKAEAAKAEAAKVEAAKAEAARPSPAGAVVEVAEGSPSAAAPRTPGTPYAPDTPHAPAVPDIPNARDIPVKKRGKSRGSRFAGLSEAGGGPSLVPPGMPSGEPEVPRGARFAGAMQQVEPAHRDPGPEELAAARRRAQDAVERLALLHAARRSGEVHVLLCSAANWPALELAAFARELRDMGWTADGTTLLWEAASLPPGPLVAAADALAAMGRDAECAELLRQGAARPAGEVAAMALGLHAAGRFAEITVLLSVLIRSRTPFEVAESAHAGPHVLVPSLLTAARELSGHHYRSIANALRGTGLPGVPEI